MLYFVQLSYTPDGLTLFWDITIETVANLEIKEKLSLSAQEVEKVSIATVLGYHQNWTW